MNEFGGRSEAKRLSPPTLELARKYLLGSEIAATLVECDFELPAAAFPAPIGMYRENITAIALHAPLRLRPDERLAGAATYREAVRHACPGGRFPGTSHTTLDFAKALRLGLAGLEEEIAASRRREGRTAAELEYLDAMQAAVDAMRLWTGRIRAAARAENTAGRDPHGFLAAAAERLERVPERPPESFAEALQALWSFYCFQRLGGNWPGLGRLDELLGPFLEADLAAGRISLDEAREWLACFWIKGAEWKGAWESGGGDAQHYQNVILGGVDGAGKEVSNRVTRLILEVVEELHESDFPIAVRVSERTPEDLWRLIAGIQTCGGGIVSIYNEKVVLAALARDGWSREDAAGFTNDGCWEVIRPGRTAFSYTPFDALALFEKALHSGRAFDSVDAIFAAWLDELRRMLEARAVSLAGVFRGTPQAPLLSLLVEDCIGRARDYHDRGALYSVAALHAGGLPDVANNLTAIEELVFREKLLTLPELLAQLRGDWPDEGLRRRAEQVILYGNGDPAADAMVRRVVEGYVAAAVAVKPPDGVFSPLGISTFGRELAYAPDRGATAFGRRAGSVLAPNLAPTPGSDHSGAGAVVAGYCGVDFTELPNGCPLDLKFDSGIDAATLVAVMKSFVELGGFYLQVDVVDAGVLREAQAHPERYANLSVRISGWSARFVTLDAEWQEMVIARTAHGAARRPA